MTVEEFEAYGMERMDEGEIRDFLASQTVGVLGLSAEDAPYVVPMSYAVGDDGSLYFTYVVGEDSRKEALTERSERATFLVFSVETMFHWRSVLLTGEMTAVPEARWGDVADVLEGIWRPELFQSAGPSRRMAVYRFDITECSGIEHTGLAPEFGER